LLNYYEIEQAVMSVWIEYPDEPEYWFRGEFLDPFMIEYKDITFNPLFQGFLLLTDNYMLFSGHGDFILASRN